MIKSISYDQNEILSSILTLYKLDRFDVDLTYGNGGFYRAIPEPLYKFDIDSSLVDTAASSDNVPLKTGSVSSVIFDPPFLTYIRQGRTGNGNMILASRFGGYWNYEELEKHYRATINEAHRILKPRGVFVVKCQDIIHNHYFRATHDNIIKWSDGLFRIENIFILLAKHKMRTIQQKGTRQKTQQHARIYHSYFLTLEKIEAKKNREQ